MCGFDREQYKVMVCFTSAMLCVGFIAYQIADTCRSYDAKIESVQRHHYKLVFEDGKVVTKIIDEKVYTR